MLVCDFLFFDWFNALKIYYPPDIANSIYNSAYGEIKNIANFINKNKIDNETLKIENRSDVSSKI